jgi:hypothetical protein
MLITSRQLPQQGGTGQWNEVSACNDDTPVALKFRGRDRQDDLEAGPQYTSGEVDQDGLKRVEAETSDNETRETGYSAFSRLASGTMR